VTSAWMMPLGAIAAKAAGTADPGSMLSAVGLGAWGAILLTVATMTTNFVNIYMSSLAWKSLVGGTRDGAVIWSVGLIGTALGALPNVWLDQYAAFMVALGAILVPVGGILIAHFYVATFSRHAKRSPNALSAGRSDDQITAALYDPAGPYRGVVMAGVIAWAAGVVAFYAAGTIGGTAPALIASIATYTVIRHLTAR